MQHRFFPRWAVTATFSLVAAGYSPAAGAQEANAAMWDRRLDSVVLIAGERTRGAGVILSSDGLVITSTKAVQRSRSIRVQLARGSSEAPLDIPARIVARDDWFTLIQLDGDGFVPVPLGSTARLKLNDRAAALDEQTDGRITISVVALAAVAPIDPQPMMLQKPLTTSLPFSNAYVGGPLFDMKGELIGVLQSPAEGNFGGTRALRVEDIRDFLARHKNKIPPRRLTLSGPPGLTAEAELIRRTPLPMTIPYRPGDVITLTLRKDGGVCGVLRPDTHLYEPSQDVSLGRSLPIGTLAVDGKPSGATVEVDGRDVGPMPVQLDCMGIGRHDVLVRAPSHETGRFIVEVVAGGHTPVDVNLRKLEGYLTLDTRPRSGEVWVDGKLIGMTPLKRAPVPAGRHVVSVRFQGGARMRRVYVFDDRRTVDAGVVNLPAPGALVQVRHEQIESVYLNGHDHDDLSGWFVLTPGSHTLQAKDALGNVMSDAFEAPAGGYHVVQFRGAVSSIGPLVHSLGWVGLSVGVLLGAMGIAAAVGIPGVVFAGYWAGGAILDAVHRGLWLPTIVLGVLMGAPCLLLGGLGLASGLLIPPWERLVGEGRLVAEGRREQPIPFKPTEGWEPRPVAEREPAGKDIDEDRPPDTIKRDPPVVAPDAKEPPDATPSPILEEQM